MAEMHLNMGDTSEVVMFEQPVPFEDVDFLDIMTIGTSTIVQIIILG